MKPFPHEVRDFFKQALSFSHAQTGFHAHLIEKDYFCSAILAVLYAEKLDIFFKGGTLLNKVHVGFYRLSEDLDFTISTSPLAKRSERSKKAKIFKAFIDDLPNKIPLLQISKPLTGSNNSVQYNAEITYSSAVAESTERILFEIGLREEVVQQNFVGQAATLAQDPYSADPLFSPIAVKCLSLKEAFAEKIRASLSREKVAIRDIYDLWHAIEQRLVDSGDEDFMKLVKHKMTTPELLTIKIDPTRQEQFRMQIETQLKPVLREIDYRRFNFDEGWQRLVAFSEKVKPFLQG